jgi:RimJ/RimL family protein N-acetyltransferase
MNPNSRPDLEVAATYVAATFALTAPRFAITGTPRENLVTLDASLDPELALALTTRAASEPPLFDPGSTPRHAETYATLLGEPRKITTHLYWSFGPPSSPGPTVRLVSSGTADGDRLYATLGDRPFDAWGHEIRGRITAPWCIAFHGDEIASIVETVRHSPAAAECGVTTSPRFRNRGYATAAARGWSTHPALANHLLFYATTTDNAPSRRVAAHLALAYRGLQYSIYQPSPCHTPVTKPADEILEPPPSGARRSARPCGSRSSPSSCSPSPPPVPSRSRAVR